MNSVLRIFRAIPAFLPTAGALLLGGCLFGGDDDPFIPKPTSLNPETDAFSQASSRTYVWRENVRRAGKDSLLGEVSLKVSHTGDTLLDDALRPRLELYRINGDMALPLSSAGPAPAAALTRLGFHAERVSYDSVKIPDPGPGLPFPVTPVPGWRLDTTAGDLRFVRVLAGVETVKMSGERRECWAFAESTFQDGQLLGTGTTWMGRAGLVRHRFQWDGFVSSAVTAGTLFREITAP